MNGEIKMDEYSIQIVITRVKAGQWWNDGGKYKKRYVEGLTKEFLDNVNWDAVIREILADIETDIKADNTRSEQKINNR